MRSAEGLKNQVGGRVRQRRAELRMTQDGLTARLAYVTVGAWNPSFQEVLHVENGTRTVTDIEVLALAQALDCDPAWLLTGGAGRVAARSNAGSRPAGSEPDA